MIEFGVTFTPQIVFISIIILLFFCMILRILDCLLEEEKPEIERDDDEDNCGSCWGCCYYTLWLGIPILFGCIFIHSWVKNDKNGKIEFGRYLYFELKRIEHFASFIFRIYILLYTDITNSLVLFFYAANLLISIAGLVYNYVSILLKANAHKCYTFIFLSALFTVQHVGFSLFITGFVVSYGYKAVFYLYINEIHECDLV